MEEWRQIGRSAEFRNKGCEERAFGCNRCLQIKFEQSEVCNVMCGCSHVGLEREVRVGNGSGGGEGDLGDQLETVLGPCERERGQV